MPNDTDTSKNPQRDSTRSRSAPCSSSEFACQYWREGKGWCESSIWETEKEAIMAHNRISAVFTDGRYRVIQRITTECVIRETNTQAHGRQSVP